MGCLTSRVSFLFLVYMTRICIPSIKKGIWYVDLQDKVKKKNISTKEISWLRWIAWQIVTKLFLASQCCLHTQWVYLHKLFGVPQNCLHMKCVSLHKLFVRPSNLYKPAQSIMQYVYFSHHKFTMKFSLTLMIGWFKLWPPTRKQAAMLHELSSTSVQS